MVTFWEILNSIAFLAIATSACWLVLRKKLEIHNREALQLRTHQVKEEDSEPLEESKETRNWESLDNDVLSVIFSKCSLIDVAFTLSRVCRSWRRLSLSSENGISWETLDLGDLDSYVELQVGQVFDWPDDDDEDNNQPCARLLKSVLRNALKLAGGNLKTLIFHRYGRISDDLLLYVASRSQNLKRLHLPATRFQQSGETVHQAFQIWRNLESIVIPSHGYSLDFMEVIGENCQRLTELKIYSVLDTMLAEAIVTHAPQLRALSICCTVMEKDALMILLTNHPSLVALDMSHSIIEDIPQENDIVVHQRYPDDEIMELTSKLAEFYICLEGNCTLCYNTFFFSDALHQIDLWRGDAILPLPY